MAAGVGVPAGGEGLCAPFDVVGTTYPDGLCQLAILEAWIGCLGIP